MCIGKPSDRATGVYREKGQGTKDGERGGGAGWMDRGWNAGRGSKIEMILKEAGKGI